MLARYIESYTLQPGPLRSGVPPSISDSVETSQNSHDWLFYILLMLKSSPVMVLGRSRPERYQSFIHSFEHFI